MSRSWRLGVLVGVTACGYADGDPIVGGDASSAASSAGTTDASGTSTAVASTTGATGMADTSAGGVPVCGCSGLAEGERCLRVINECGQTVWAGGSGDTVPMDALAAIDALAPGECTAVAFTSVTGGRVWGRTGCVDDVCASDGGAGRGTLVQFDLSADGTDLYDVSLVDGFDLPVAMQPLGVDARACQAASCAADLRVVCPDGLAELDPDGEIAWCRSICRACSQCDACNDCAAQAGACDACMPVADTCCTGTGCEANEITQLWKSLCPDAITYSGEGSSTCDRRTDFDVVFCP